MTAWGRVKVAGVTSLWSRLRYEPVLVELDGEPALTLGEFARATIIAESRPCAILFEIFMIP